MKKHFDTNRLLQKIAFACCLLGVAVFFSFTRETADSATTKTTYIYLVRHAEQAEGPNAHLASAGLRRVAVLVDSLKNKNISMVFTTQTNRTYETAKPVADYFGLTPRYYNADTLTRYLKGQWNQNILVVTHSLALTELVRRFDHWPGFDDDGDVYDNFIVIKRTKTGNQPAVTEVVEGKYGERSVGLYSN